MKIALLILVLFWLFTRAQAQKLPSVKATELEQTIQSKGDGVLVLNFWATFCKPCIAEIPHFIQLTEFMKPHGVELLLVSLDTRSAYPKTIRDFVKAQKWKAPMAWLDETNADYFCPKIDPAWSGSIPATLIINHKTGYRKFYEEELNAAELEKAIRLAMDSEKKSG